MKKTNNPSRMLKGKKAIEAYIGWIFLIGFSIVVSTFMYSWINSQVQNSVQGIEQRADTSECDSVGLTLNAICQDTQTLNMNITNIKLLTISGMNFRFFDLYDNQDSRSINITISPVDTKKINIIKQGTLKQVEIIPIIKQNNKIITCRKSMITSENINIC